MRWPDFRPRHRERDGCGGRIVIAACRMNEASSFGLRRRLANPAVAAAGNPEG
ncbi:hypothetical protein TA3x_002035 [Tundrisphaera sp. TA3]|uniref:hypothetical protein n=1 Tax=Tundrisphaera sp. TA3 TaxID=3435775 RepID=UPI003EBDD4A0